MSARFLFLLVFSISPLQSYAETLTCQWLPNANQPEGFFVANSSFELQVNKRNSTMRVLNDSFFFRSYSPCYSGNFKTCAFGFSYDRGKAWGVKLIEGKKSFIATQSWYFTSELKFRFEGDKLFLSGDDGDGVSFDEVFSCKIKPLIY